MEVQVKKNLLNNNQNNLESQLDHFSTLLACKINEPNPVSQVRSLGLIKVEHKIGGCFLRFT